MLHQHGNEAGIFGCKHPIESYHNNELTRLSHNCTVCDESLRIVYCDRNIKYASNYKSKYIQVPKIKRMLRLNKKEDKNVFT